MAGVTFTIAQGDEVVAQGVSPGTDHPLCFEELEGGSYQVAQILPRNLETTTATSTTIEVEEGSSISLEFGSRFKTTTDEVAAVASPTAVTETGSASDGGTGTTNQPDSSNSSDGSGLNLLAVGGLVAILIAIVLLGALIFFLVRQQRGGTA